MRGTRLILGESLGRFGLYPRRCSIADFRLTRPPRPEDIFGSVEVDGHGEIIGNFQASGTYRIVTREGM